jgi:hypothetical protein
LPDIRFALRGDFLLNRAYVQQMGSLVDRTESGGFDDAGHPDEWKLMKLKSVERLNEAEVVKFFRKTYAAIPSHIGRLQPVRDALDAIQTEIDHVSPLAAIALNDGSAFGIASLDSWAVGVARRRVLSAALDVFAIKAKTGAFPATWSKAGDDGIDPFSDKPLVYRRIGGGFVVYSFDRDRVDNGGRPYTADDGKNERDISFEYPKLSVKPVAKVVTGGSTSSD